MSANAPHTLAELDALARGLPRLGPTCGKCPACRLGPTKVTLVGQMTWATCRFCSTKWPLDPAGFAPVAGPQLTYVEFLELVDLDEFPDLQHRSSSR
jgi:hypothetical protein